MLARSLSTKANMLGRSGQLHTYESNTEQYLKKLFIIFSFLLLPLNLKYNVHDYILYNCYLNVCVMFVRKSQFVLIKTYLS